MCGHFCRVKYTNNLFYGNYLIKKVFFPSVILLIIFSFGEAASTWTSDPKIVIEDTEPSYQNGICESITNPTNQTDCWKRTNETHSCCMVTFNGEYKDPTILEIKPPSGGGGHRLRILSSTDSNATSVSKNITSSTDSNSTNDSKNIEFNRCVAIIKNEKPITSMVRKFKYKDKLYNSYFICNTTDKIRPCGPASPSKFADCNSHSSDNKKCCVIDYLDLKTCGVDLNFPNNNSNNLGVNFSCNSSNLKNTLISLSIFILLIF